MAGGWLGSLILCGILASGQNLVNQPMMTVEAVRGRCLSLPADPAEQRFAAPQGRLLNTRCQVTKLESLASGWFAATYRWTSRFAGSPSEGIEEESVVFEPAGQTRLRPVWHVRFELGDFAALRSVAPEIALQPGGVLLVFTSCLNGTGGCTQDFHHRDSSGKWTELRHAWLSALPPDFAGRIRHGFTIDPQTLEGEAALYADDDPNCCPSQRLLFKVRLSGDTLILERRSVVQAQ